MNDLTNWKTKPSPDLKSVKGRYVRIDPAIFPEESERLFASICGPNDDGLWFYIPIGPFNNAEAMGDAIKDIGARYKWRTHILSDVKTNACLGTASYMRIRPEAGSAEVGCIIYSNAMQKTPAATESMYLMARHVFDDLGYRRYEWKCDNANEASKRAAKRLGFSFEGVFRKDMIVKGRNRDTAWFSITDDEWPALRSAFETWLAPENFDQEGRQKLSLADIREGL